MLKSLLSVAAASLAARSVWEMPAFAGNPGKTYGRSRIPGPKRPAGSKLRSLAMQRRIGMGQPK